MSRTLAAVKVPVRRRLAVDSQAILLVAAGSQQLEI
jgi:hypothetical protein